MNIKTQTIETIVGAERPLEVVFTLEAWAKIEHFVKKSKSDEVSGFGIGSVDNPMKVEDFHLIKQVVGGTHTEIEGPALAEHVALMARQGIEPFRCMRVWIHSHPFSSNTPSPSGTDTDTILNVLGEADWAVMVIVSSECQPSTTYAELMARIPFLNRKLRIKIDVKVPWESVLNPSQVESLDSEFTANVSKRQIGAIVKYSGGTKSVSVWPGGEGYFDGAEYGCGHFTPNSAQDAERPFLSHFNPKKSEGLVLNPQTKSLSKRYIKRFKKQQQREIWKEYETLGHKVMRDGILWSEWLKARLEGFTADEIVSWGCLVTSCTPEQLRKAAQGIEIDAEDFSEIP